MRKLLLYGAIAMATAAGGIGAAVASMSGASTSLSAQQQALSRIHNVERAAARAHISMSHSQLTAALQRTAAGVRMQQTAKGSSADNSCPPTSQGGRNGITVPPCGIDHNNIPLLCPPKSKNGGGNPPCGHQPPPTQPPAAPCGPADQGGSAATGPLTGPLYGIGKQISDGGGAPLGDLVQQLACAVNNLTGL